MIDKIKALYIWACEYEVIYRWPIGDKVRPWAIGYGQHTIIKYCTGQLASIALNSYTTVTMQQRMA